MNNCILQGSKEFLGFYEIPGYSRYAINKDGRVINKELNSILTGGINPDGYVNFGLTDDNGYRFTWGRHRLMAFIFKNPNVDITDLVVNHKNAIKGDDRLDNLEWTTYQGNAEHAGSLGLTEKCLPLSVRCIDTGEITKFPSIVECARAFGMSKDAINYRVKNSQTRIFPERKQYRLNHSDEPWHVFTDPENELLKNGTSKTVRVRHVLSGVELCFGKISDLSDYLDVPASTLTLWINKPNQPVLPGFIQLKWGYGNTPWRPVIDARKELDMYTGKRTVKVVKAQTGEVKIFSSGVECAKEMNLLTTTLNYRLKSNRDRVYSDGYKYSYY